MTNNQQHTNLELSNTDKQIQLAREYCLRCHEGQTRKFTGRPYYVHPFTVAEILAKYGYNNPITQCIALLHDTVKW